MSVLSGLELHPCLRARMHRVHPPPSSPLSSKLSAAASTKSNDGNDVTASTEGATAATEGVTIPEEPDEGFVLYLPTVCLRYEQNPSFALACRAANHLRMPLVVLAVVVDDASHAYPAHPHRYPPINPDNNGTSTSSSSSPLNPSVVMTSRRLAFTLQALSHACTQWSTHGAAVGIRIHAANSPLLKGARTPDHLTLATRASLVITDEPFVSPFTTLVHRVEEACRKSNVECIRVDGSCTVPPVKVLRRRTGVNNMNGKIKYDGVPGKAYQWQSKTEHIRESHLRAAMEGHFDAPELNFKMEDEDLFAPTSSSSVGGLQHGEKDSTMQASYDSTGSRLAHLFPSRWKAKGETDDVLPSAPDVRPFTSRELSHLYEYGVTDPDNNATEQNDGAQQKGKEQQKSASTSHQEDKLPFHKFALNWPGADPTVPPCPQTIGTTPHGMARWNNFMQNRLSRYGKERNDARLVHSVSRMSAYLNLGIVSIFRLVWEVKRAQKLQQQKTKGKGSENGQQQQTSTNNRWNNKNKSGADKFEEEIVKWREMSYAHAFSRTDYDDVTSLPQWSVTCLDNHPNRSRYTLEELATGRTGDAKWDAMQQYLVRTGELHNNVRMTWGKTVVEWMGCTHTSSTNDKYSSPAQLTTRTLIYLNDRYALDGLSPPSYAGLLWTMGWTDKPSGSSGGWVIAKKPAARYRMTPDDFQGAEIELLASRSTKELCESNVGKIGINIKRQTSVLDMMKVQPSSSSPTNTVASSKVDDGDDNENDSKPKYTSKGLKRSGPFTIDSFFSKRNK